MIVRRVLALLLLLTAPRLFADAPGVYAITGGTVHPVSGPEIPNGTVLIRNGLVEAVGAKVAIPPDAATIDATGLHVYPGLIDAQTSFGFASTTPRRGGFGGGGGGGGPQPPPPAEPTADSLALRTVKISDDDADSKRATGVLTINTAPANGIFNGQSVVLNLGTGSVESRAIKHPAAMEVAFNTRPTWTWPDSLMGVISYIRQMLFDAQQHSAARAIYEKSPAGLERPAQNPALDALVPVLSRDLPVIFAADSEEMIRRVQKIANEFNLRYVIAGAREGYAMAGDLKNVPVLVSVKWATAPADKEDREEQPLRLIRERQLAPTTPSEFVKNGVQFALVSGPGKTGDFLPGIRKAIDNGLSADDALRATTLWPARILGVDRQLGSLDRGKIANVVVTDKPIFTKEAKVKRVFVDGREIRLTAPEEKKEGAGGETSPAAGTWSVSVRVPSGNVAMQFTLKVEDGKVSGTFSGDRGSGEVRSGTFDGTTLELTISVQTGGETGDWVFHGTVAESKVSGTVTTTIGQFDFTGSKTP